MHILRHRWTFSSDTRICILGMVEMGRKDWLEDVETSFAVRSWRQATPLSVLPGSLYQVYKSIPPASMTVSRFVGAPRSIP